MIDLKHIIFKFAYLTFMVSLIACEAQPVAPPSPTPIPTSTLTPTPSPSKTQTPTITPTQTSTPSRTPTSTKTPTRTPTSTPDLEFVGQPEVPVHWSGSVPPGNLRYDKQHFYIFQETLHGRPVTVACEKSQYVPESNCQAISEYVFSTFINWWEIFQGFPYQSYTVVLRKEKLKYRTRAYPIGYEDYVTNYYSDLNLEKGTIAHEIFHAWVGSAIEDVAELKFRDGSWFIEGITQYYGTRALGAKVFKSRMENYRLLYILEILDSDFDISLTDMPTKAKEEREDDYTNSDYWLNVYIKGALVGYLIDQRLAEKGLNFDHLLKYMYDNFTLKKKPFQTKDVLKALNTISGEDWSEFFKNYIYGTEPLPLEDDFEYLQH